MECNDFKVQAPFLGLGQPKDRHSGWLACELELPTPLFCSFLIVDDYEIGDSMVCRCPHLFRSLHVFSPMGPERQIGLISCPMGCLPTRKWLGMLSREGRQFHGSTSFPSLSCCFLEPTFIS